MRVATPIAIFACSLALMGFNQSDQPARKIMISTDYPSAALLSRAKIKTFKHKTDGQHTLLEVLESDLPVISKLLHETTHRCGGFFVEEDEKSFSFDKLKASTPKTIQDYPISNEQLVKELISQVDEQNIRQTIHTLSNFRNRYYQSPHGSASQNWLKDHWKNLVSTRDDAQVSLITHTNWSQPSVMLTITGSSVPEKKVVLGGHGDSIAGWFPDQEVLAPGADDNASGIATLTEVIRILGQNPTVKPAKTLIFYSYAAEEVGLRGSQEIARQMRAQNAEVVGVMQLDMTNFHASSEEMVFITDNTDPSLTRFGQNLLTTYLPEIRWANDRCGYACSDHASWTRQGYPAFFPFESKTSDLNRAIHTKDDTLEKSHNTANHAVPFAKIALAFAIEMAQ